MGGIGRIMLQHGGCSSRPSSTRPCVAPHPSLNRFPGPHARWDPPATAGDHGRRARSALSRSRLLWGLPCPGAAGGRAGRTLGRKASPLPPLPHELKSLSATLFRPPIPPPRKPLQEEPKRESQSEASGGKASKKKETRRSQGAGRGFEGQQTTSGSVYLSGGSSAAASFEFGSEESLIPRSRALRAQVRGDWGVRGCSAKSIGPAGPGEHVIILPLFPFLARDQNGPMLTKLGRRPKLLQTYLSFCLCALGQRLSRSSISGMLARKWVAQGSGLDDLLFFWPGLWLRSPDAILWVVSGPLRPEPDQSHTNGGSPKSES